MSSSELSELTSASSESENEAPTTNKRTIDQYFKNPPKSAQPPKLKKKRPPSPAHEYVLADREEIAFLVMFRSRFSDVLPKSLAHLGPHDIENGIVGSVPGDQVERLLCGILGLLLNRKKEVEKGHYNRALEDAISEHRNQWPKAWESKNPLRGDGSFNNMSPEEKLVLLRALVLWSLDSSEAVKLVIKESYKQSRHDDDLNQPLSVQPWGRDGDKRRFWLIEGQDDTHFRLYRESNPALKHVTWRSVAGSIEELKEVVRQLDQEDTMASRRLRDRIQAAIPRFEAGEEKRRRRDYRLARKAQFTKAEPGFSLYEGRTRGKRMKYTYSDEEGVGSDDDPRRRSNRQSGLSTPAEPAGPRFTASGRQIRSRHGGGYGESLLTGEQDVEDHGLGSAMDVDDGEQPVTRGRGRHRTTQANGVKVRWPRTSLCDLGSSESSDHASETASSNAWNGGDDDDVLEPREDEDDNEDLEMSEDDQVEEQDVPTSSLVVRLRYGKSKSPEVKDQYRPNTTPNETIRSPHIKPFATQKSKHEAMDDATTMLPAYQSRPSPPHQANGVMMEPLQPPPSSVHHPHSPTLPHQSLSPKTVSSALAAPPMDFNPRAFAYKGEKLASHGHPVKTVSPGQVPVTVDHSDRNAAELG